MFLNYAAIILLVTVARVFGAVIPTTTTTTAKSHAESVDEPKNISPKLNMEQELGSNTFTIPPFADPHAAADITPLPIEVATNTWLGSGFFHALIASFSIIIFTELGDKTFFIAAIMSMSHSRLRVFAGAITALILMTVLSSLLGFAATVIPHEVTHYAAAGLFAVFGLKMLYDAWKMKAEASQEEYNETVLELREREVELPGTFGTQGASMSGGASAVPTSPSSANDDSSNSLSTSCAEPRVSVARPSGAHNTDGNGNNNVPGAALPWKLRVLRAFTSLFSIVFLEALTLTFLAEWGDRSQISTIVLAARGEDFWGVNLGACVGHSMCTGLACIGGSLIAKKISPRQVMIAGGLLFLGFSVFGFVAGP